MCVGRLVCVHARTHEILGHTCVCINKMCLCGCMYTWVCGYVYALARVHGCTCKNVCSRMCRRVPLAQKAPRRLSSALSPRITQVFLATTEVNEDHSHNYSGHASVPPAL